MKTKPTFRILYLERGNWKAVKDENNKEMSFNSVDGAKRHIDILRSEGTHPLCRCYQAVIYKFNGCMMEGEGIRY